MQIEFTRHRGARSPVTDAPTFRVSRLVAAGPSDRSGSDLSHLIDRTYNYHSSRELHWHLADRLGLAPGALSLRAVRERPAS